MLVFGKVIASNIGDAPLEEIIARLSENESVFDLQMICAQGATGAIAILSAAEAMKPFYANIRIKVVGMAYGKAEAKRLLADMLRAYIAQGQDVFSFKRHCLGLEERV